MAAQQPHPLTIARLKSAEARRIARSLGQRRYSTGRPCSNGHISERRVADGMCIACASKYSKRYYAANREQQCAKSRDYQRTKLGYYAYMRAMRKARKFGQVIKPNKAERNAMIHLFAKAKARTILTGKLFTVDHIKPLSAGGLHMLANLQICTLSDNMRLHSLRNKLHTGVVSREDAQRYMRASGN